MVVAGSPVHVSAIWSGVAVAPVSVGAWQESRGKRAIMHTRTSDLIQELFFIRNFHVLGLNTPATPIQIMNGTTAGQAVSGYMYNRRAFSWALAA
jgi:hypothetical protein